MNKRHRAKRHRSNMSAESRGALKSVLIWVGAALFAVLLTLIVGNLLGNAADKIPDSEKVPPIYEGSGKGAPSVDAVLFDISKRTDIDMPAALSKLADGCDVSIALRGGDLKMCYRSDVALAVTGNVGGYCDLSSTVGLLSQRNIHISACFYSGLAVADTEASRDALIAYESALIFEAVNAGIGEILVLGLPTDSDGIAYASKLFSAVRDKAPDLILGAAVGYEGLATGDAAYAIDTYARFANFCALDTSTALNAGTNAATVVSENTYYFEKYPLRLLISDMGGADRAVQVKSLNQLGIYDIQSVALYSAAG